MVLHDRWELGFDGGGGDGGLGLMVVHERWRLGFDGGGGEMGAGCDGGGGYGCWV